MKWTKEQRRTWENQYRVENRDQLNAYARGLHAKHRDLRNARSSAFYYTRREEQVTKARDHRRKLREATLDAYGGVCACCGEFDPLFLTIDHVNGGGKKHLKEVGGTEGLYRWLRANGFPKDEFRLLCYNCNMGRARNGGVCPHVAQSADEEETIVGSPDMLARRCNTDKKVQRWL